MIKNVPFAFTEPRALEFYRQLVTRKAHTKDQTKIAPDTATPVADAERARWFGPWTVLVDRRAREA